MQNAVNVFYQKLCCAVCPAALPEGVIRQGRIHMLQSRHVLLEQIWNWEAGGRGKRS